MTNLEELARSAEQNLDAAAAQLRAAQVLTRNMNDQLDAHRVLWCILAFWIAECLPRSSSS
jgi:hypothetical protein